MRLFTPLVNLEDILPEPIFGRRVGWEEGKGGGVCRAWVGDAGVVGVGVVDRTGRLIVKLR